MHTKLKLTLVILALPVIMFGQNNNFWSKTSAKSVAQKDLIEYSSKAVNPLYYNLDKASLTSFLVNAPDRFSTTSSSIILNIPNPTGTMDRFEMFAVQTMAEGLGKRYATIKSYVGRNLANKAHTLRITITPQGFYAMTLGSSAGQTLINPLVENSDMYMVFSAKEAINTSETLKCEVEDIGNTFEAKSTSEPEKFISDGILRKYRLAVATTVEYSNYHLQKAGFSAGDISTGGRTAVQAAIVVSIDRINEIYERDLGITLELISNNDVLINLGLAADDPYTNNDHSSLLTENQAATEAAIGSANYDVGHVFCTKGGGLAQVAAVCSSTQKAKATTGLSNPIGDKFIIDLLAHELGHQFGARHTQSSDVNENRPTAVEPGSGTTIMGYAGVAAPNVQNFSDAMFHYTSISEISTRFGFANTGSCAQQITTGNTAPVLTAVPNYTIPANTPFKLEVNATDANGDALTYSWDQIDNEIVPNVPMPPASTSTAGPSFRTFLPSTSPARYFPAMSTLLTNSYSTLWEVLPTVSRTLNFGVIVRDNNVLGGQVSSLNTKLTVDATAGPFRVTSQSGNGTTITWTANSTQTVIWDVANTSNPFGINAQNVDILLSTDSGVNFNTVLVSNTPNDGTKDIVVPNIISANARLMIKASNNIFFDINEAKIAIVANAITCAAPQNIVATNITNTTADISWAASESNPSSGYDYVLITDGTTPNALTTPTGNVAAGATSISVTGLNSNAYYEVFVRANCGVGNLGVWSASKGFTTTCTAIAAPYTQNFNSTNWQIGSTSSNYDGCWNRNPSDNTSKYTWAVGSGTTPTTGTGPSDDVTGGGKYLFTEADNGQANDLAILNVPPIDISTLTTPRIQLSYHMFGANTGTLKVQVKEVGASVYNTQLTITGQQQTSTSDAFMLDFADLSPYLGKIVNIRIVAERGGGINSDIAIDQFEVKENSCTPATNIRISNLLTTSINLNWDTVTDAASGYEWVIMAGGVLPDPANAVATGTVAQGITNAPVTGLIANTNYTAYIRSDCGAFGQSAWSPATNFKTLCTIFTAPITENFDASNTVPNCWALTNNGGAMGDWIVKSGPTSSPATGPLNDVTGGGNYLYIEATNGATGNQAYLNSLPINLSPLTVPRMKLSYHMYGSSIGTLNIQLKEVNATAYTTVFSISGQQQTSNAAAFREASIDLSAYANQTVDIRIVGIRGSGFNSDIAIDQFIIEETTICDAPASFSTSNITLNSANLSWSPIGTALNGYEWVVMADGVAPNNTTAIATGTVATGVATAQATGLVGSTNYDAYVRTNCGAIGLSNWSTIANFFTGYCPARALNTDNEKISNITFNTINKNSTSTAGYENFTATTTTILREQTYNFSASFTGTSFLTDQVLVWIDFNQDLDFEDAGELVLTTPLKTSPWTGTITIPANAAIGNTIMRVRLHDSDSRYNPNSFPCGDSGYGQVEDYSVEISNTLGTTASSLSSISVYSFNKNIHFSGLPEGTTKVALYDILGKLILRENINKNEATISINNLQTGIYIVNLKTETGILSKKIIVY